VLYSPDTGEEWYDADSPAGKKYWTPFNTIVPGDGNYPDIPVTLYYQKKGSPDLFYRATNVPELYRRYRALEISFNKRMADGWQMAGSVVFSRSTGNIGAGSGETFGWSSAVDTPNYFVNRDARLDNDRPIIVKLMGTAKIPLGFYLSGYFRHFSGAPWGRTANVNAPASWVNANNAISYGHLVQVEPKGTRRYASSSYLDLRLEKEFVIAGSGRLGFYIDLLNVMGTKGLSVGTQDINLWFPVDENSAVGTKYVPGSYKTVTSVYGQRVIKASVRFSF